MGLISDLSSRILSHDTSLMWGKSTAFLLAVGLSAGCASRPVAPPAEPTAAAPVEKPAVTTPPPAPMGFMPGEVSSTSSADGRTHLQLALLPELQEGDLIHILADERVVATALITAIDATSATALVTGLTDRTREVVVGDRAARLVPEDVLPAITAAPSPAAETASVAVATISVATTTVKESAPALPEHPPTGVEAGGAIGPHGTPLGAPQETVLQAAPTLAPEVRARLTAERAYFDLATRVLRLPAAGPELTELQERLRIELAALELLP